MEIIWNNCGVSQSKVGIMNSLKHDIITHSMLKDHFKGNDNSRKLGILKIAYINNT
jgi:hypothetical protein